MSLAGEIRNDYSLAVYTPAGDLAEYRILPRAALVNVAIAMMAWEALCI